MSVIMPDVPELGIPEGTKQTGQRVDFKPTQFDILIETKGYLVAWERAIICPCIPVSDQTQQPDPNCPLCHGSMYTYIGGSVDQDLSEYNLTDWQSAYVERTGAMIIRGFIRDITHNPDLLNVLGRWIPGGAYISVRHDNKIAYYDRITAIDAEMAFTERLTTDGTATLVTKYPVVGVNFVRSIDDVYDTGDYTVDNGQFKWTPNSIPAEGTIVSLHYLCPPTWLIMEHPHNVRATPILYKTATPTTPTGTHTPLPVQAMMQFEFLTQND